MKAIKRDENINDLDPLGEDENKDLDTDYNMDDSLDDTNLDSNLDFMDDFSDTNQTPLKKHQDLLRDLTNFAPYLKKTFNNWLGISWDEEQGKYVKNKAIKPIMNIYGASWCVNFLETYARSNNIITDIGQEDYNFMVEDMIDVIYFNLGLRKELGIKNSGDLIMVSTQLLHAAQLVLMGAGDGKYNKFLGTTFSTQTHVTQSDLNRNGNMGMGQINPMMQDNTIGTLDKIRKFFSGKR